MKPGESGGGAKAAPNTVVIVFRRAHALATATEQALRRAGYRVQMHPSADGGRPARLYRYRDDAVAEVKARRLFP